MSTYIYYCQTDNVTSLEGKLSLKQEMLEALQNDLEVSRGQVELLACMYSAPQLSKTD